MRTTNLVELLRDISLRLGILIKTSELPSKQEKQNQIEHKHIENQSTSHINHSINTKLQSMSARSIQPGAELLANSENNHHNYDYNYIYNKSTSCNPTRTSIGSAIEQDEVRTVIVTGKLLKNNIIAFCV